ncbi:hypothetical protein LCGC14_0458170 [marine sediment metagenome]|uniref:Uncharacterized protein n=1 Tax=marine sediment metagenome TaxID=412755 RepID=A0A0F9SLA5_9ZZZZ
MTSLQSSGVIHVANEKHHYYRQDSAPGGGTPLNVGDLWSDTTTNLVKRCTNSSTPTFLSIEGGTAPLILNDDVLLKGGDDGDWVAVLNSAGLAADDELTDVIEGTSDHQGTAANSFILSNITDDGDMLFLVSDGGNSKEFLFADADVARLTLGWGMTSLEFGLGGAKEMIYTTGAMAFQQATAISTTTGHLNLSPNGKVVITKGVRINNNQVFGLGNNEDGVIFMRTTVLAADDELTNVIVGTSDHQGVAAKSLIISNVTDDGDMLFLVSDGGNSLEMLRFDADVATADLGFAALITKFMAASTTLIEGNGTGLGFFATTPAAQPTSVAVDAAGIHAALVTLGLITA